MMRSLDATTSLEPSKLLEGRLGAPGGRATRIGLSTAIGLGVLISGLLVHELADQKRATHRIESARKGRRRGGVLFISGGKPTLLIMRRFIDLAGGDEARIVVIPTAHASADGPGVVRYMKKWQDLGVEDVELLHTRSHEQANRPEFGEPLEHATGVWFEGGKQSLLAEAYADTAFERELHDVLSRGGVIGGNSAGAAIMSKVMITEGKETAKLGLGFDLLPGVIIDQHFLKRNRFHRLRSALHKFPLLLGLGIDERTAIIVEGKHLEVIGDSYVTVCLPEASSPYDGIEVLRPGDETDLDSLRKSHVQISHAIEMTPADIEHAPPP